MTQKPGSGHDLPNGGEQAGLEERIAAVFSERFDKLDRLQQASTMTQDDLDFLRETKALIEDCERRKKGELNPGPAKFLQSLRETFDAADGLSAHVLIVEAEEGKKKKKKEKKVEEVADEGEDADETGGEDPGEEVAVPTAIERAEQEYADDEVAMAWLAAARYFEEKLADLEAEENPEARKELLDTLKKEHADFVVDQLNPLFEGIEADGNTIEDFPYLTLVADTVDAVGERLEQLFQAEASGKSSESFEDIWNRFNNDILVEHGEINTLLAMPMDTEEEVRAARETFDMVIANMKDYLEDWKKTVSPILDDLKAKNQRWGPWGGLSKEHGALVRRFFGRKAKAEGEETIEGVLQQLGRRLRERSREIREEKWNEEFPDFAADAAKLIINLQDARLRREQKRVDALNTIREDRLSMDDDWKVLRAGGPRLSREEREKGAWSPVHQYDVLLRDLERDIRALIKNAPHARPARLDDVAYLWREALLRTDSFWKPGLEFMEKVAFLKRYGSGEVKEEEIDAMIRTSQRERFIEVAQSDVLTDLRKRGVQRRERREYTERRERAQLYHPKLEMLRMDAKDMYRSAINARFWKDDVPMKRREALFAEGAVIEEEELQKLVKDPEKDVSAYRRMFGMVNGTYKRVKEVEDPLYLEGKQPEGKVKTKQLRRVIERYLEAEEREIDAWKDAKNAPGWGIEPFKRDEVLHGDFDRFWHLGQRAFEDEGFRRADPALRSAIVRWIFARLRLRTLGVYAQWLIDENPDLARSFENMPREFRIPEKEVKEFGEDDDTDEVEVSDAEKADRILPVQDDRTGDEAGGGAFEDIEGGAAVDIASREGSEGDDDSAEGSSGGASERSVEGREAVLETKGSEAVKKLTQ